MQDSRAITVLLFDRDECKMCVVVVEQERTRLLMDGDGPGAGPLEVCDHLLWPALELPEADLQLDGMFGDSPLIEEIETAYRGWFTDSFRRKLEDGRWAWKCEIQVKHICGPPSALGYPLPSLFLSDGARDMVREYAAQRSAGGYSFRFGPEVVDQGKPAALDRGLPPECCVSLDAPLRVSEDPSGREVVVLQGSGEQVTLMLRGYARLGSGPLVEMFVPFAEVAERQLGSSDLAKFQSIRTQVWKFGASGAKWITLSPSGEWLSGAVCKDRATRGFDQSPKPVVLLDTDGAVCDYLAWRATAYGQQVNLLTDHGNGNVAMLPFFPEGKSTAR